MSTRSQHRQVLLPLQRLQEVRRAPPVLQVELESGAVVEVPAAAAAKSAAGLPHRIECRWVKGLGRKLFLVSALPEGGDPEWHCRMRCWPKHRRAQGQRYRAEVVYIVRLPEGTPYYGVCGRIEVDDAGQ